MSNFLLMRAQATEAWERAAKGVLYLGCYGFHGQTIADALGITKYQVWRLCRQVGIRLRDYRDGKTKEAKEILAGSPCLVGKRKRKSA